MRRCAAQDIAGNGHEPEEIQRGDLYARLVRRARAALAAAKPGAVLAGALWCAALTLPKLLARPHTRSWVPCPRHQGESDAGQEPRALTYSSRLRTLIRNLREDTATPAMPFVMGELGTWLGVRSTEEKPDKPYADAVRACAPSPPPPCAARSEQR